MGSITVRELAIIFRQLHFGVTFLFLNRFRAEFTGFRVRMKCFEKWTLLTCIFDILVSPTPISGLRSYEMYKYGSDI